VPNTRQPIEENKWKKINCIVRESNPGRIELATVSGNDPGYHYPNNALIDAEICQLSLQDCSIKW
jgi:hypothetical protein